jgi:beta-glucosidase
MRIKQLVLTCAVMALVPAAAAMAQTVTQAAPTLPFPSSIKEMPWLDVSRSPDERATLAMSYMTLDEKIQFMHGNGMMGDSVKLGANGGAGYVQGLKRFFIPDLNMADSTVGVTLGGRTGRYSTLLPATLAEASSWDPTLAFDYGALVGRELRSLGYNVTLAGGANLAREPRNGRVFEYRGEDPVLAGKLVAQAIRGVQSEHVISDLKHYALNDQETGRAIANIQIDYKAARESDLLAFEIGVKEGEPGMVMCSYNKVNGDWVCENDRLLNTTLKKEWGFKGFVISDWGATHSTQKALMAGLDQEQPESDFFGPRLKAAIADGSVPMSRIDDAVHRILRTMFASGVVDFPPNKQVVDVFAGFDLAQRVAEAGSVLLKNTDVLPLKRTGTVAIIGGFADVGVVTGGGSGQVDPPGGNAVRDMGKSHGHVFYPSSPLKALKAAAPDATFVFDDGSDPVRAAEVAKAADVAIVFAYKGTNEGTDSPDLSLPYGQDALIAAVADANPRNVVVLETGGPVTMPWIDKAGAVVEAWFPGAKGGEAISRLLLGDVNFSGKLPITFPKSEADLPFPTIRGKGLKMAASVDPVTGKKSWSLPPFDVPYTEGAQVGYKWFDATGKTPLFPFGHGLSYTHYDYSHIVASSTQVTFTVKNTGSRAGVEISQVYASLPVKARHAPQQLVGWVKTPLAPGESQTVTVKLDPLFLSVYDVKASGWKQPKGRYELHVGSSSRDLPLTADFVIK